MSEGITKLEKLERENLKLRKAIEELSILNEIATAISSTLSMSKLMDLIVDKCIKHLNVEQCALMIFDEANTDVPYRTIVKRVEPTSNNAYSYSLTAELIAWMIKNKKPLKINDLKNDKRFLMLEREDISLKNILCVPLTFHGKMIGIIYVVNKKDNKMFTDGDERLLSIISGQSAQAIENSRLLKEEQNYICIQEELRMAKEIQINLLPKKIPKIPGYDIAAINIPESEVGGDYYDFIYLSDFKIAFCLGDVSGKGLPAALLMANLQATLRGQSFVNNSPKDIIRMSNLLLFNSTDIRKFATIFYGILDYKNHQINFCNAGHENPLHLDSQNKFKELVTGGTVLGFLEDLNYFDERIKIEKGELIILYSDGITEAMNKESDPFGSENLRRIIKENSSKRSEEIIEKILSSVQKHTKGYPQFDDITLLVIKRN